MGFKHVHILIFGQHSKLPPETPLEPPKKTLRPPWTLFKHLKFKYNILLMIFGQIKLKIYAFTTSDQDVVPAAG